MKINLNIAVIGAGRIGKIHIENLTFRIPETQVVAVADADPDIAAKAAEQFNIPTAVSDYKEILSSAEIDAVIVCSPTNTHAQIVQQAAAAGKHIFCEKPIDLSLENINKTLEAVETAAVKFMVGFNRRFDPNFQKVHEIVTTGKIGKPYVLRITSRDPAPPPAEYIKVSGGIFLDMAIHDFDMARYLINSEIKEIYTKGNVLVDPVFKKYNDLDTAVTTLTFENGTIGTIDNCRQAVYGYDQRVEVFGADGMVTVTNNTPDNHILIDRNGSHRALPLNFFMDRYVESYYREMLAFIDCIKNDSAPPITGNDGKLAVVLGLAAILSDKEKRAVAIEEIILLPN